MFTYGITNELTLETLQLDEADILFTLIQENKTHLGKWLPWVHRCKGIEDVKTFIQSTHNVYAEQKGIEAGIKLNKQLIGVFRLTFYQNIGNIGYWIHQDAQGQGIVTKTVKYMTEEFAHELDGFDIFCPVGHVRSERVAMKAGFQLDPHYQPKTDTAFVLKRYIRR
ncbi:GNAT family N-acetyltransferase [Bacillus sp. 28A-2]|uniref:GNAT family N-acetyltransferase n=1 Tax=Bacillus sp. 28A-2 TaxID=2772252 RepID=UPI00168D1CB9|nr:GNAT family N-acetyltransferase [Bacillus sp. 28A-2]MBD3860790.1 GNAT family N-acetyltransferase [Bacillus sp. 28A-2]